MRFKNLSQLKRPEPREIVLATLPQDIVMTHYAREKAFKINELVRTIFEDSLEWYGFTLADRNKSDFILDIGLPKNDQNLKEYTTIGSERIANFQESLPKETIINGWIHSHGSMQYKQFSNIDEENHLTVLDFVATRLRKPVAKKEITIKDLSLLVKDQFVEKDLEKGSVALVTNGPVSEAMIMETVYGSFCYSIVIGDEGWHEQKIHYKEKGVLSGFTTLSSKEADIRFIDTDRSLSQFDINALSYEVEEKIQPNTNPPQEMIERL